MAGAFSAKRLLAMARTLAQILNLRQPTLVNGY
jgi:hypothetical protein